MTVFRSYATWVVLAAVAGLAALFGTIEWAILAEVFRVLVLALMLMEMIAYAPAAGGCFVTPGWPRARQWGALGMFFFSALMALAGIISLFYRLSGKPDWIVEHPVTNAWAVGAIVHGIVFNAAPGFFGERVDASTKRWIGFLWALIVVLLAYVVLARPDTSPAAEWIRQHIVERSAS